MKRAIFRNQALPWLLLAPQLAVTFVFFLWPAAQAGWQSFLREDAFGLKTEFIGLANYTRLIGDAEYLNAAQVTVVFSVSVAVLAMAAALLLALAALGYDWNHSLNADDAMVLVVIAAAWKQISYNFLFFVAGLQAIPASLREAAAIDGAGPVRRFWTITFPLLAPTSFFLLVVNTVYAMFDTLPVIDATTEGGPAQATNILVYKVYVDGFLGLNLGSSAAQSVLLMAVVVLLTVVQFRYIERRVEY